MATVLQLVQDDLSTVDFDFNSPTGSGNPSNVITIFGVGGGFELHPGEPEFVTLSPASSAGGRIVSRRDPLGVARWGQIIKGTTHDTHIAGLGELARLIAKGGTLKWIADGSSETRFVDFEPSATPVVFDGRPMGLWQASKLFYLPEGVQLNLITQPYTYGPELDPAVNLAKNGMLLYDFASPSNRPDGWTWDDVTGISDETISADKLNWGYQFTIANAAVHNLQYTTTAASVASGDVAPFQFEARVTAVAGGPKMRAMVEYMQSDGTTQVGADQQGTLTALTTTWQRLTVTPAAAGALTSRVRVSLQVDNDDATSVTIQIRKAQPEVGSAPSLFRAAPETVAYDPAVVTPSRIVVFGQGNAPTLAKVTATADAQQLAQVRISRESDIPVDLLKATLFKQLESGTLGTDTTSAPDGNASGANAASVNFTNPTPAHGSISTPASGTSDTITVVKPSSLAEGDAMVCGILRAQDSIIAPPDDGWQLLGKEEHTTGTLAFVLYIFLKIATAEDVAASVTDYTFTVVYPGGGTASYRAWIERVTGIDSDRFLASPVTFQVTNNNTTVNIPTITTDDDNAMVVAIGAGMSDAGGALAFTVPAGATPTYTERDDGTADVTHRGMAMWTGVLATAGATGAKTSTAAIAIYSIGAHFALRRSPAAMATRSTVTFTGLPAGSYRPILRGYPTAASIQRWRLEYALMASPTEWISLGDYVIDASAATAFAYIDLVDRFAPIHIPEEHDLATLTVRVVAGLEETSTADARFDFLRLVPANEQVGVMTAKFLVTSGEYLVSDAEVDKVFHLDSSQDLKAVGTKEGPTPIELQPGLNLLDPEILKTAATGFADRASVLGSLPTFAISHSPRYRT